MSWGVSPTGVIMHHDQDPVFTGFGWTAQLLTQGARSALLRLYALGGAKDNPEMESFIGRFKVENHSLFLDAQRLEELVAILR